MTTTTISGWRRLCGVACFLRVAILLELVAAFCPGTPTVEISPQGKEEKKIVFRLPKGNAVTTLAEAARQANIEFICAPEILCELKTPAINGSMSVREMFALMLSDSSLIVKRQGELGVYVIKRKTKPNGKIGK